ncbi:MAG: cytochrome b/b6 domain-containing protein [Rhodospirillales bacterium]|nr:MAG: cytochrome b/b6 domain-containing protein [Rhodospirillales bacterium]
MVYVWDPLVRLLHWSLVIAFFTAYVTEDETLALHVWAGYVAGGVILLRIPWGFFGPKHARFTDFVRGPRAALRYLVDLVALRARRHIGHSPAGGAMVLMLMVGILATVWSGLELYAAEEGKGPLAIAPPAVAVALADDDDRRRENEGRGRNDDNDGNDRGGGDFWEDVHETLAHLTFLLVLSHLGGVVLASFAHRENLVRSMITGWKRTDQKTADRVSLSRVSAGHDRPRPPRREGR